MSEPKKTILYVDTNDEITSVITKLQEAPASIVAVVLPKRAPSFQSIINIKLLKKAAEKAKKKTVLITSDKTVLPLAGAAGMHVARTTESKPYIPDAPTASASAESAADENAVDPSKPVGELADKAKEKEDTIDLGDLPNLDIDDDAGKKKKKPKKKGVTIPNFNKFRLWLILGGVGLVLLIIGWYVAAFVLPRAEIIVETSAQSVAETIEFDVRTDIDEIVEDNIVLPAVEKEYTYEDEASVRTTGERNVGDRATGTVTVTNCETSAADSITISEGNALIAANGRVFRATETVQVSGSTISGSIFNPSCDENGQADVPVRADNRGADYNISASSYTVEGYSSQTVYGSGTSMTGGTDEMVSVVASRDIRAAREEVEQGSESAARAELEELHDIEGLFPVTETFNEGSTDVDASHEAGDETDEVTVSISTRYTMLGVSRDDLRRLIELELGEEFDFDRQAILDDGLDEASLRVVSTDGDTTRLRLRTIVSIGPDIDIEELTQEIAGMRRSETESAIFLRDGVREVQIDYAPFWVFSTPDNPDKITITIVQQGEQAEFPDETEDEDQSEE